MRNESKLLLRPSRAVVENAVECDWPGWELNRNTHGDEFDADARCRMIAGGDAFRRYISEREVGGNIAEFGPFFSPILDAANIGKGDSLYYIENDTNVLSWLRSQNQIHSSPAFIVNADISTISSDNSLDVAIGFPGVLFDTILLSQVINYVNYKRLLEGVAQSLSSGSLLYLNNVVDYGLPKLFSPHRPKSIEETLAVLRDCGFEVVDKAELPPPKMDCDKRLLVQAVFHA